MSKYLIIRFAQVSMIEISNLEFTNWVNTCEKKRRYLAALNIGVFELAFFEEAHNFFCI